MKNKLSIAALTMLSLSSFAGTMGDLLVPERFFLIEGGVAYTSTFYKDHLAFPEFTLSDFPINGENFYPNNFLGGYIGASFAFPGWLINGRYSLYEFKSKENVAAHTTIGFQPAKLSLTVDKAWDNFYQFSYGLGGGAVAHSFVRARSLGTFFTDHLQGRTEISPLVETFLMYHFANNFGAKFNVEYQIPVNHSFTYGAVNLTLGLNYAIPV